MAGGGGGAGALATFASLCTADQLPAEVASVHKAVILDAIACAAATWATAVPIRELFAAAGEFGEVPELHGLLVSGRRAPAVAASLNGALVHGLVFDAAGARGAHLGMVAFAPALAVAEWLGRPVAGADLLAAAAVACEVHDRLMRAERGSSLVGDAGWLDGQLLGVFGACAGAGRVLGLSPEQMESAFGLAMMQASGSREIIRGGEPPVKALYGGPGNLCGVLAAMLAASGVDARCDPFHGPAGMLRGWFGLERTDMVEAGLGVEFLGAEVNLKEWPVSGAVQPYVHTGRTLRAMDGFDVTGITSIRLLAPSSESRWLFPLEERLAPRDAAVACNSIPFGLACSLLDGEVRLADLSVSGLRRADAARLLSMLEVELVDSRAAARVEIVLASGASLSTPVFTEVTDNFGTLRPDGVADKLRRSNAAHPSPLGEDAIEEICDLVDRLEDLPDIARLTSLLVGS